MKYRVEMDELNWFLVDRVVDETMNGHYDHDELEFVPAPMPDDEYTFDTDGVEDLNEALELKYTSGVSHCFGIAHDLNVIAALRDRLIADGLMGMPKKVEWEFYSREHLDDPENFEYLCDALARYAGEDIAKQQAELLKEKRIA